MISSSRSSAVSNSPVKNASAAMLAPIGHHRRAEREQRGRVVGRRIGVRHRAAERAAVADLRVADRAGERRERRDGALHVGASG